MKSAYLLLAALTFIPFQKSISADTITFNVASGNWSTLSNWSSNSLPQNGDIIIIPSGSTAIIDGGAPGTVSLSGVTIKVKDGGILQIGTGNGNGNNSGNLILDISSVISLEYSGVTRAMIVSNAASNASNNITINGVVKFQGNTAYSVNAGSGVGVVTAPATASSSTGSLALGFSLGSLPVVLVGFNANLTTGNKVGITWSTQQEINTDRFEIERSNDGVGWQTMSTVKATGYSSTPRYYSGSDVSPRKGANLYRIRVIDFDGKNVISAIVNVMLSESAKINVFPNPSANSVYVSMNTTPTCAWGVSLVNSTGQIILQQLFPANRSTAIVPVSTLPNGVYTIEISYGAGVQSALLQVAH